MTSGVSRRKALTGAALLGVTPVLVACGDDADAGRSATDPTAASTADSTADAGASSGGASSGGSSASSGGFATVAEIPEGGGAIFADEGVVVTQPAAGEFKAFTNICTHQKCPVSDVTDTINCTCHGSRFSIQDGSPQGGPATSALAEVALNVAGESISLA